MPEVFPARAGLRRRQSARSRLPAACSTILLNCGELVGMLKVTDPHGLRTCLVEGSSQRGCTQGVAQGVAV
jgi:hypothetical protein